MRTFSFRDLLLIPDLSKYNEIELLHPTLDKIVFSCLGELGFDLDYPIEYIPAQHRDIRGRVGVGFRAVGEISTDRRFINSPLCSLDERLVAASYTDISLTQEMAMLMGSSASFIKQGNPMYVPQEDEEEFPEELIEPTFRDVEAEIKVLQTIKEKIRGTLDRNEFGGLRAARDYL